MDRLTPWERDMIKKGMEKEKTEQALSGYELERQQFACNSQILDTPRFPNGNDLKRYFDSLKPDSPNAKIVSKGLDEIKNDPLVFHPEHYTREGIEVISVIRAYKLDFLTGSAIKYILRSQYKDNEIRDLKKAIFNLQLKVADLEKKNE